MEDIDMHALDEDFEFKDGSSSSSQQKPPVLTNQRSSHDYPYSENQTGEPAAMAEREEADTKSLDNLKVLAQKSILTPNFG